MTDNEMVTRELNKEPFASIVKRKAQRSRVLLKRGIERRMGKYSYRNFFFVLGIGGSGTQWCAAAFTTEKSHCWHEASQILNAGPKRDKAHFNWLANPQQLDPDWRRRFVRRGRLQPMFDAMAQSDKPLVGNADMFAGWFCDAMHDLNPTWKFILVVRDGIKSVSRWMRMLPWRYYHHFQRAYLPRWDDLSDFERCCMVWSDRNRRIHERLMRIPEGHRRVETLEALTSDLSRLHEVWDWIGLEDWETYEKRNIEYQGTRITRHKENSELKDSKEIWNAWSSEQKDKFLEICGQDMESFGFKIP